jgi:hypothetical protein
MTARVPSLLLALLLPFLGAWRPYDTMESQTPPPGHLAVEWGLFALHLKEPHRTLALPDVRLRLAASQRIEVGLRGVYRTDFVQGQLPHEGQIRAADLGLYGKWVLISGVLQNRNWIRPSISVLGGVRFLTHRGLWGMDTRLAGSFLIGPVVTHLNIGYQHDLTSAVLCGAVVAVPLPFGLTPAAEVSGEVHFGEPSLASAMVALTQALPWYPISVDVAVRRGLTAATPDWQVTAGLTLHLRLFRAY